MSEFIDGAEDRQLDFDLFQSQCNSTRTAEEWLLFLEKNEAFPSIEIKAIVQSLNIESLKDVKRSIALLNGSLFEGKRMFPFSTSAEAAKRKLEIPGPEIICPLFELIINDQRLLSMFRYFVIISDEFDDGPSGVFYLAINSNNGKPIIEKFYSEPIAGCFACKEDVYVFEG